MIETPLAVQAYSLTPFNILSELGFVHMRIAQNIEGPLTRITDFSPADKYPWGYDASGNFYWGWGPIEARQGLIPDAAATQNIAYEYQLSATDGEAVGEILGSSSSQLAAWMDVNGLTYSPIPIGEGSINSAGAINALTQVVDMPIPGEVNAVGWNHLPEVATEIATLLDPSFSIAGLTTFGPQIMSVVSNSFPFSSFLPAFDYFAADGGIIDGVRSSFDPTLVAA